MTAQMKSQLRRGVLIGALSMGLGVAVVVIAIGGAVSGWLIVPGVLLILIGTLRLMAMGAVLALEKRRQELLRSGTVGTVVLDKVERLPARGSDIAFEMEVTVSAPGAEPKAVKKRGSVPAQFADKMVPGAEFPARIDDKHPELFAIDWNAA